MTFKQWERNFDACLLDRTDVQAAWRTLVEHGCTADTLKSALYHAAEYLSVAEESPKEFGAYFRIRKDISEELSKLKRDLRRLTSLTLGGERMLSVLWSFYQVKSEHVVFFNMFPTLLERLEKTLTAPKAVLTKRNRKRAPGEFVASGEAVLHIYVKETTRRLFPLDTALVLEGGAIAYRIDRKPSYDDEAVKKRYRRYKKERDGDHNLTRLLVRQFVSETPRIDLHMFVNRRTFELGYNVAMDYLEDQPEAMLRSSWEKLTSRAGKLASSLESSRNATGQPNRRRLSTLRGVPVARKV
jgi:hypothetical protein